MRPAHDGPPATRPLTLELQYNILDLLVGMPRGRVAASLMIITKGLGME